MFASVMERSKVRLKMLGRNLHSIGMLRTFDEGITLLRLTRLSVTVNVNRFATG